MTLVASVSPRAARPLIVTNVEVQKDIAAVDASQWDSVLGPDDLQMSHRFIRACQSADIEHAEYRFVSIEDGEGIACVAALSCFDVKLELLTTRRLRTMVVGVRRAYDRFLRVRALFCGLPVSFGRPCLRFRRDASRRECLRALEDVMTHTARELDASIVCWKEFDAAEASELGALEEFGYVRAASLPSCRLEVRWSSFAEYVGQMRSPYRRQVHRSQQMARAAGLEVRTVEDLAPWRRQLYELYDQVMDRVEFQLERLPPSFFDELNREFPAEVSAILAERDGRVVAHAIVLDSPGLCAFLLAGIDYERNRDTNAYVTVVTKVVEHAIRRGAAALEMGQTSYDIKRRLGAHATPRFLYLRHRSRAVHGLLRMARTSLFPERGYPPRHVFRDGEDRG